MLLNLLITGLIVFTFEMRLKQLKKASETGIRSFVYAEICLLSIFLVLSVSVLGAIGLMQ